MGFEVVATIGKDESSSFISQGGLTSGLWTRVTDKGTIIIRIPFLCSEGLREHYCIPSILQNPRIKLNLREEGCRGNATVICDEKGDKLVPFYINKGTAYFKVNKAVAVSVEKGKVNISQYMLVISTDGRIATVLTKHLVEMKSVLPKKYKEFLLAVEAVKLRSKLNENPNLPVFCSL
jgi:hypothetical protein